MCKFEEREREVILHKIGHLFVWRSRRNSRKIYLEDFGKDLRDMMVRVKQATEVNEKQHYDRHLPYLGCEARGGSCW